ncbi:MAG: hypothetical protein N0E48_10985 [Candidatus Thiodiazotropha endolucinida]|nr:hypothetical protein [Candidatus Thiodiazotropha taylori]MCW4343865.1 hypothetical protein [Candidatus Thiodiazotropha endolucinida]
MAQAQLDIVNFSLSRPEISRLCCQVNKREIVCWINDSLSLTVKRINSCTQIEIKEGRKKALLSLEQYEALCDLKLGVQLLDSFLRGNLEEN